MSKAGLTDLSNRGPGRMDTKDLEAENARLRKAVADLTLDKQILAEAARGNC